MLGEDEDDFDELEEAKRMAVLEDDEDEESPNGKGADEDDELTLSSSHCAVMVVS